MEKRTLSRYLNQMVNSNYGELRRQSLEFNNNKLAVYRLVELCCQEGSVEPIRLAFNRLCGKPVKPVVVVRTTIRTKYPNATEKALTAPKNGEIEQVSDENQIVVREDMLPSHILGDELRKMGEADQDTLARILENPDKHTVATVIAANFYSIIQMTSNLASISLLFDLFDGAVADVIQITETKPVEIENYAEQAPAEAKQDNDGVYYVETIL